MRYGPYVSSGGHLFWVEIVEGKRRSVWVHREVVEQELGRKLLTSEIVHHKDGDKANNAPENLEVTNRSNHARFHHSPLRLIKVVCANCGKSVVVKEYVVHHNQKKQGKAGPFCNKNCAGKWSRGLQIRTGKSNLRKLGM